MVATQESVGQSVVMARHHEQYQRDGYFVLESVVPQAHLQMLRERAMYHMGLSDGRMRERGVEKLGSDTLGSRYFIQARKNGDHAVDDFIFSDLMADITRALLGDDVHLFHEQFVVKAAEKGASFSWHQDSGYVGYEHKPYLTCWVTLDDVTEENGTVYMLPYDRAGTREVVEHIYDEKIGDRVGYFGPDRGEPVICPAGSIACFSSTVFHSSGANTTSRMRRIYLPQYSAGDLRPSGSSAAPSLGNPFIVGGQRVRFGAEL